MDVGIVVAGISVGTIISRRFVREEHQQLLTISIGLSIALFCCSILELLPTDLSLSYRNILRYVYHWILYGINAQCFVVIPTAALLSNVLPAPRMPLDEEEHKKRSFRRNYWWNCYIYRPMMSTMRPILSYCLPNSTMVSLPTTIVPSPTQRTSPRSIFHLRVIFAMFIGTSCTFWALSRIRSIILILTNDTPETWLQVATSSLCAIGILLSAILNGFASVSLPYTCLLGFFLHPVSDVTIRNAEQELENLRLRLESTKGTTIVDPPRIVRRHRSSDISEQPPQNGHQTDFLRALMADMVADMDEMKYVKSYNHQRGMIHRIVGSIGGMVLLVRWSIAVRNICNGEESSSSTIPLLQVLFPNVEESTAQVISVVLTAVLSVSQLRTFVNVATAVERRVRKTCCVCMNQPNDSTKPPISHTINATLSLFIGFLLDCYSLACVVLTKQMMIQQNDPTDVLYLHRVRTNRYMFDLTFASSALVSTAVLAMVLGILRANSQRWYTATATAEAASASKSRLVEV